MKSTKETTMFPQPEHREIRNSQGEVRPYVRYPGQSRWYRALFTAQAAFQRDGLLAEYRRSQSRYCFQHRAWSDHPGACGCRS